MVTVTAGQVSSPITVNLDNLDVGAPGSSTLTIVFPPGLAGVSTQPATVSYTYSEGAPGVFSGTTSFQIATTSATSPGTYSVIIRDDNFGGGMTTVNLVVSPPIVVPPPGVLVVNGVIPSSVTSGTQSVLLRLTGSGFQAGATVEICSTPATDPCVVSPLVTVERVTVASSRLINVTVSVRRDAPASTVYIFVKSGGFTRPFGGLPLRILPADSVAAPLGVTSVVVSYPRSGTHIRTGQAIKPQGLLAVTGSGTVTGSWLLDGVAFDRFTINVQAGRPTPVPAHVPIPQSYRGAHSLQLLVDRPQRLISPAVSIFLTTTQAGGMRLFAPADGYVWGTRPASFRWTPVPGAAAYEVEMELPSTSRPLQYRTTDSRWQPTAAQRSEIGAGMRRWRVRAIFPGEIRQEPTEWRRLVLLPDQVQLEVLPLVRDVASGLLELRWGGGSPGILYRLEVLAEDGNRVLYTALTGAESHRLPQAADVPGRARIRVTALGPDGMQLGSSQTEVVFDAPVRTAADQRPRVGVRGVTPEGSEVQTEDVSPDAGEVQTEIKQLVPADGSMVESGRPVIQAGWSGAVTREQLSLRVDATDVTSLSNVSANAVSYTPILTLAPGEHIVELSLAGEVTRWTFSIGPPTAQPAEDAEQTEQSPPAAVQATREWVLNAETGVTVFSGDTSTGGEVKVDQVPLALSGQVDYDSNRSSLQLNADSSVIQEIERERRTLQDNASWIIDSETGRGRNTAALKLGYTTPSFLMLDGKDTEFLSAGPTRGGVEASVSHPSLLKASLFHSFNPEVGNVTSGDFDTEQTFRGGALEIGGGTKPYMLRLVGIDVQEKSAATGGDGSSYGFIGTYAIAPGRALIFEGTRGEFNPAPGSLDSARSGNAGRIGLLFSGDSYDYAISTRRIDADYVNPANRGFTAGGRSDRDVLEGNFLKRFDRSSMDVKLLYEEGGDSSGPKAHARSAAIAYTDQPRTDISYTILGNLATSWEGDVTDKKDYGIEIKANETRNGLGFYELLSVQWHKDDISSAADTTTINTNISINGPLSDSLLLATSLNATRTLADPAVGDTDVVSLSVQPTFTILNSSLSFRPLFAYNVTMSDVSDNVTTENYIFTVEWTPPWRAERLALSLSAGWGRTRGVQGGDSDFLADYTAGLIYRWGRSGRRETQGIEVLPGERW
jgi:hypothetical protein